MQWNDVYVNAVAVYLPPREDVKVAAAEGRYDPEECEEDGLVSVPVAGLEDHPAKMAIAAGNLAIERSNVPTADFDLVLHATTSYQGLDHWTPGSYIQEATVGGLAQALEVKQTCNGGMASIDIGAAYVSARTDASAALVTTSDRFALPQYDRYRSDKGMVRGDGATALVLSKQPGVAKLLSTVVIGDSKHEGMGRGNGGIRAEHMKRPVMTLGETTLPPIPAQKIKRWQRLENRRPHRVVINRTRHHRDQHLIRRQLRHRHRPHPQRLPNILVRSPHEHIHILGPDMRRDNVRRHLDPRQFLPRDPTDHGFGQSIHAPSTSGELIRILRARQAPSQPVVPPLRPL